MPERLRALLDRLVAWWGKFSSKQKTLIVIGASSVLLTIVILVSVLTRPVYVTIYQASDYEDAKTAKQLLDDNNINYKMTDDGMTFSVLKEKESQANILLGANQMQSLDYSIDNVTNGSFSTTESDKQKKFVSYLEKKLATDFTNSFDAIDSASVELSIPENDGTLISEQKEASATLILKLNEEPKFTDENAAYLAKAVSAALGNKTTDSIVIMDSAGNMLFSGGEEGSTGLVSSQLNYKSKAEQALKTQVRNVLLGTKLYDNVEVGANLAVDFSNKETVDHQYSAPDGATQGLMSQQDTYESTNQSGVSGVPGTDSNDETSYVTQDNGNSTSSVEQNSTKYLPNEKITTEKQGWGGIDYATSTVSVSAINYVVNNEADYKASEHNGLSWREFKAQNAAPIAQSDQTTIDQMVQMVNGATGIPTQNVTVALYDQNVFFDKTGAGVGVSDILQILLIIAILGLLGFVIFRSMRTAKEEGNGEDQPEELSVEQLLESQPSSQFGNIELEEASDTMKSIAKFVNDNPEAAASLLRNWLNEGNSYA